MDFSAGAIGRACTLLYQGTEDDTGFAEECEIERGRFKNGLDILLKLYRGTPIERELRKVDPTAVIFVMGC